MISALTLRNRSNGLIRNEPWGELVWASLLIVFLFTVVSFPSSSLAFSGKVVGVSDGDTIAVMHQGKGVKVMLYGIDCPEKGQAFGRKAKRLTSDIIFERTVEV